MQGFGLTFKAKNFFFDRKRVMDFFGAQGKKTMRALSRAGAFVRTRARSSMRRRKKPSAPGKPPSAHRGDLKEKLYFAYDPSRRSVVIGPVKLNALSVVGGKLTAGTVPATHEFGGSVGIREKQLWPGGPWRTGFRSVRAGQQTRVRMARYPARPYMQPALQAEIDKGTIPKQWATSVVT